MRCIFVNIIAALLLVGVVSGADIAAKAIKFYGIIEGDGVVLLSGKTIEAKKGDRLEFDEYAPHSGLAPNIIDVAVIVMNQRTRTKNIEVRVAVSPKVGKVVLYQGTPDLPIHEKTETSSGWLAPILLLKQTVKDLPPSRDIEVTFRKINLGAILKDYIRRNLWPVMLNFEATVEPSSAEQTFKNNTVRRTLKVQMWE